MRVELKTDVKVSGRGASMGRGGVQVSARVGMRVGVMVRVAVEGGQLWFWGWRDTWSPS